MADYEGEQFAKLKLVIEAALQNPPARQTIVIKTSGYEPDASVKIEAHILKKFLKN